MILMCRLKLSHSISIFMGARSGRYLEYWTKNGLNLYLNILVQLWPFLSD